ncbi:MAG: phage tail tape measure protein [Mangrovicoccus sp.]|nr:phage tail tape measure protein [Mangrovicoccus sp.]
MTIQDELDDLEAGLQGLDASLATTRAMAFGFSEELGKLSRGFASADAGSRDFSKGFSRSLKGAFEDLLLDGAKVSDVLRDVGQKMVSSAFRSAITPVANGVGQAIGGGVDSLVAGLLPFAQGGAFSQGRVTAFAKGGVVSGPVAFPMRGGAGLMGEAGPEAIMPLVRGADGALGVRAARDGGGPVNVTFHIQTPDTEGFRRSQGQIAAQMGRVISQGRRLS